MASSELAIDVASWAMRLEQLKAEVASRNIATASLPGSKPMQVNFAAQLESLRASIQAPGVSVNDINGLLQQSFTTAPAASTSMTGGVALDTEVADLTSAELRYKTLAEGLSRQLSLLTLAASGKQ